MLILQMSVLSQKLAFLQVKRICQDSGFATPMSFGVKLSLPVRCFCHCYRSHAKLSPAFTFATAFACSEAIPCIVSVEL